MPEGKVTYQPNDPTADFQKIVTTRDQISAIAKNHTGAARLDAMLEHLFGEIGIIADHTAKKNNTDQLIHDLSAFEKVEEMPRLVNELLALADEELGALIDRTADALGVSADQARTVALDSPLGRALNTITDVRQDLEQAAQIAAGDAAQRGDKEDDASKLSKRRGPEDLSKTQGDLNGLIRAIEEFQPDDFTTRRRRDELLAVAGDLAVGVDTITDRSVGLIQSALSDLRTVATEERTFIDMEKSAQENGDLLPSNFYDRHGHINDPTAAQAYLSERARRAADAGLNDGAREALVKNSAGPTNADKRLDEIAKRIFDEAEGGLTQLEAHLQACDYNPALATKVYQD